MTPLLFADITIFVLSLLVGFEVITKVPATLHTPLMSGANAVHGVVVVGVMVLAAFVATPLGHALLFIAAHLRRGARQSPAVRPHPMTCFRYSSGFPDAPASDMYMAAHSKSSWNALGECIANFNATLFKPRSRGSVT